MSTMTAGALIMSFSIFALLRLLKPIAISPTYGLIIGYLIIFVGGVAVYNPNYSDLDMSSTEALKVLSQVFLVISSFIAGAYFVFLRSRDRTILRRTMNEFNGVQLSRKQRILAFALPIICMALVVSSYGLSNLWYSADYLPQQNLLLSSMASIGSLATALVLGLLAAQERTKVAISAIGLQALLLVLMAAESTRRFAVLPLLFCFGALIARPASRAWRGIMVVTVLLTPITMMVPLTTRAMDGMGVSTFPQIPRAIAGNDIGEEAQTILNNAMMGPPLTNESERPISSNKYAYVLTSINPMPGVWTNWYQIMERVNLFEPFNALGDLLRAGLWVALLYYGAVGAYFARIELRLRSKTTIGPEVLVLIGLAYAFIIMSTEYPLRTVTRYIYYMIGVEGIVFLLVRMKRRVESSGRLAS